MGIHISNKKSQSLLLATRLVVRICLLTCDDFAQHHHAITVHEGDAGEALAILEGVGHERLLRLEADLGHLV